MEYGKKIKNEVRTKVSENVFLFWKSACKYLCYKDNLDFRHEISHQTLHKKDSQIFSRRFSLYTNVLSIIIDTFDMNLDRANVNSINTSSKTS